MLKVTYKMSNLFSLKVYSDSNLNCRSYPYPTTYALRSSILGSVIVVDGIEKAKELFPKIKNAIIYVKMPIEYMVNGIKLKRYGNGYYKLDNKDKVDRDKLIKSNFFTTMGFRELVDLKEIVFYIDETIPNLELYLKNIDFLGASEGLVYLSNMEEVDILKDVLVNWSNNLQEDVEIYENWDWNSKIKFEHAYFYSDKYTHSKQIKSMNYIKDIVL